MQILFYFIHIFIFLLFLIFLIFLLFLIFFFKFHLLCKFSIDELN